VQSLADRKRIQGEFEARRDESLCSFVRAFDCRDIDTWILRAAFEQIQPLVKFPIRKSDNFYRDLKLDAEDIDDIAEEIAQRTGRLLDANRENPYFGRVTTVEEMVLFFTCQPKQDAA